MADNQDLQMTLYKLQKDLNVPKNQLNDFGNYKYRSCEDILSALKVLLPEGHYILLDDDIVSIGDRVYVKATACICNNSGGKIFTTAFAREQQSRKGMDEAQCTGSSSSYARKYALNGLFCLDDTKDPDTNEEPVKAQPESNKEKTTKTTTGGKVISDPQRKRLFAITKNNSWEKGEVTNLLLNFGFDSSTKITIDKYNDICDIVEKLTVEEYCSGAKVPEEKEPF